MSLTLFNRRSPMDGAKRKGREAALQGERPWACPYPDKRMRDGRSTWCRAFRSAWYAGYFKVAQRGLFDEG